jgi:hypothetical protein
LRHRQSAPRKTCFEKFAPEVHCIRPRWIRFRPLIARRVPLPRP